MPMPTLGRALQKVAQACLTGLTEELSFLFIVMSFFLLFAGGMITRCLITYNLQLGNISGA